MGERRALLDPEMYKISEEDSQDEEVRSSLYGINLERLSGSLLKPQIPVQFQTQKTSTNISNYSNLSPPELWSNSTIKSITDLRNPVERLSLFPTEKNTRQNMSKENQQGQMDSLMTEQQALVWNSESKSEGPETESGDDSTDSVSSGSSTRSSHGSDSVESESYADSSSLTSSSCSSCKRRSEAQEEYGSLIPQAHRRTEHRKKTHSHSSPSHRKPLPDSFKASHSDRQRKHYSLLSNEFINSLADKKGNVSFLEQSDATESGEDTSITNVSSSSRSLHLAYEPDSTSSKSSLKEGVEKNEHGETENLGRLIRNRQEHEMNESDRSTQEVADMMTHFQLSKASKVQKEGKLSRFLNKTKIERPEKAKESGTDSNQKQSKKMFRFKDEYEGIERHIELLLSTCPETWTLLGRRAKLIESMLGILPGHFSENSSTADIHSARLSQTSKIQNVNNPKVKDRIMVAGLIPGSPAALNEQIKIGDWLQTINGHTVYHNNVDFVLSSIQRSSRDSFASSNMGSVDQDQTYKVNLGLKKVSACTIPENEDVPQSSIEGKLYGSKDEKVGLNHFDIDKTKSENLDENDEILSIRRSVQSTSECRSAIPDNISSRVILLFIGNRHENFENLEPEATNDATKEVLYSWPLKKPQKKEKKGKESQWKKVVQVLSNSKGMFSTLHQVLHDVTGSHPTKSKVQIEDDLIEISYGSDRTGNNLLILAITLSSKGEVIRKSSDGILDHIRTILLFKWGSFMSAFCEQEESETDRFISNALFPLVYCPDFTFFGQPETLLMNRKTTFLVENLLYDFESKECSSLGSLAGIEPEVKNILLEDEFYCIGTCIFYKEKLVVSHMDCHLLELAYKWMMTELNKWSLSEWKPLKRLILWQNVFIPFEQKLPKTSYIGLIGMEYFFFMFILVPVNPVPKLRLPHTLYLKEGFEVINQLLLSRFRKEVNQNESLVQLKGLESMRKETKSKKKNEKLKFLAPSKKVEVSLPSTSSSRRPKINRAILNEMSNGETELPGSVTFLRIKSGPVIAGLLRDVEIEKQNNEYFSYDSTTSRNNYQESLKSVPENRHTNSTDKIISALNIQKEDRTQPDPLLKPLSVLKGDVLFSFYHLDHGVGILLSTEHDETYSTQVIKQFQRSALITHNILQKAAKARKTLGCPTADKTWSSKSIAPVCEHGVLFKTEVKIRSVKNKKRSTTKELEFWVVGRLEVQGDSRETYVCYQDTTIFSQSIVEAAFKLTALSMAQQT